MRALPTACISDPSGASVERGLADPRPTLPSIIRRQGDSRCCPGWSGFGRPGVRIGRGGSADQRGHRRAAPADSALRRNAGPPPPATSPPPQSEEPKPFGSRLAGCASGCNKSHVCLYLIPFRAIPTSAATDARYVCPYTCLSQSFFSYFIHSSGFLLYFVFFLSMFCGGFSLLVERESQTAGENTAGGERVSHKVARPSSHSFGSTHERSWPMARRRSLRRLHPLPRGVVFPPRLFSLTPIATAGVRIRKLPLLSCRRRLVLHPKHGTQTREVWESEQVAGRPSGWPTSSETHYALQRCCNTYLPSFEIENGGEESGSTPCPASECLAAEVSERGLLLRELWNLGRRTRVSRFVSRLVSLSPTRLVRRRGGLRERSAKKKKPTSGINSVRIYGELAGARGC